MSFESGRSKVGGRQKGTPNKSTAKAKEFVIDILNGEEERIRNALTEVYEKDKKDYLDWITKNLEFAIPKRSRVEHVGDDGGPLEMNLTLSPEQLSKLAFKMITEKKSVDD